MISTFDHVVAVAAESNVVTSGDVIFVIIAEQEVTSLASEDKIVAGIAVDGVDIAAVCCAPVKIDSKF